jgi:V/A-type H+-transporting ATPase subunit A
MFTIRNISGPLVKAQVTDKTELPRMLEIVHIGKNKLLGEVIGIRDTICDIQVYEDTTGLEVGEPVERLDDLLSVELGPGLLTTIFDGIQRPLKALDEASPVYIQSGIHLPSLDRKKKWTFHPTIKKGATVRPGTKIGYVQETELTKHWIMVPSGIEGTITDIHKGEMTITETAAVVEDNEKNKHTITLMQRWPVKIGRPIRKKTEPEKLFNTGQRVIDSFFPILLGAPVSTPGPFGAGKTFTQQQLAKWSDAQIVVYVGCGERGNEMTEMVKLFPTLDDPRTGRPLMERTVLIANTSNMPIAAREASIYTGITIAEYFRDMGYDVVLMADSTSRWAEAMREVSARLGELPAEEGYPAYLSSRVAAFYERAGVVETLHGEHGSVTAIGTVSPPGGDFSEPVTQASLKVTRVFLALDEKLASKRHFPAINWQTSYSLYEEAVHDLFRKTPDGAQLAQDIKVGKKVLEREDELIDMVKIVGMDGLSNEDKLALEISRSLREDFLQQNGFDPIDTYCSFEKMQAMLRVIIAVYEGLNDAIFRYPDSETVVPDFFTPEVRSSLSNMKYSEKIEELKEMANKLHDKAKRKPKDA